MAEASGLLHEGDEILEVNEVELRGKNVNEVRYISHSDMLYSGENYLNIVRGNTPLQLINKINTYDRYAIFWQICMEL